MASAVAIKVINVSGLLRTSGDARRVKEESPPRRFTSPWIINDLRLFDLCSYLKPTVTHYQSTVSGIEGGCLSSERLIQRVVDGNRAPTFTVSH
ncbi:hypothetical protein TNCT_393141 [Trichonephila clavata]|uniref:Uncharacterized protein n=1 Tax=Trichonephila clavata TaxID=2740835 RepID=A0A8X6F230_TRICU|nr:hypothetical protein TNCT_393141 [Trichonephila clavata]